MTLSIGTDDDGRGVVHLRGRFDAAGVPRFRQVMAERSGVTGDVHLDLTGLVDVSVDGVEALGATAARLAARRRRMVLLATPPMVSHLLALGLGDLLGTERLASPAHPSQGAARRRRLRLV